MNERTNTEKAENLTKEPRQGSQPNKSYQKIRGILLKTLIVCFSLSAFFAISMVLFGEYMDGNAITFCLKLTSTLLIVGLLSLFSMNNFARLAAQDRVAQIFPKLALVSNIFWVIPWILLVWGAFEVVGRFLGWCTLRSSSLYDSSYYCNTDYYDMLSYVWRLIGIAITLSVCCIILSNFLAMKKSTQAISVLRTLTIVLTPILGFYVICCFLAGDVLFDSAWQLFTVLLIIEDFGLVVTPILVRAHKGQAHKAALQNISPVDETKIRAEIEKKVRAEILAEQQAAMRVRAEREQKPNQEPSQDERNGEDRAKDGERGNERTTKQTVEQNPEATPQKSSH